MGNDDFLEYKNNFHHAYYSLIAFLTVAIIVISLFFSGIDSFAVDNNSYTLVDSYSVDSEVLVHDETFAYSPFLTSNDIDSTFALNYNACYQTGFNCNSSIEFDTSTYPHYLVYGRSSNDSMIFNIYISGSFICFDDNGYWGVFYNKDFISNLNENSLNEKASAVFYDNSTDGAVSLTSSSIYYDATIDNVDYYYEYYSTGNNYILSSDMPIYHVSDIDSVTSIDGLDNYNSNSSGGDGETSQNNLFLVSGVFTWTKPKTGYFKEDLVGHTIPNMDNWFKGSVNFEYTMTPYQLAHPEEFSLKFVSNVNYSCYLYVNGTINDPVLYGFNDPFGGREFIVPFTDLVNTNTYSRKLNDIMSEFRTWFDNLSTDWRTGALDPSISSFTLNYSAYVIDNNGNSSSPYSDTLNFLTNKVSNKSHGITNNNYPYNPSDGSSSGGGRTDDSMDTETGFGNVPTSSSGSNSQNYGGYGGVTQINNNTNTNNGGDLIDYADKMMTQQAGDGDSYTEQLSTVTESNGFISYMSNTFSFLPAEFWDKLTTYFAIFLGILVGYFVLRMLLDLL